MSQDLADRWAEVKARGNPTLAEMDDIDSAMPQGHDRPAWWRDMMEVRRDRHDAIECRNQTGIGSM